jgi:hypothetical protein
LVSMAGSPTILGLQGKSDLGKITKRAGLLVVFLGTELFALAGISLVQIEITWEEYILDVGTVYEELSALFHNYGDVF